MSESTDSPRHAQGLPWASMAGYGLALVGTIMVLVDRHSQWKTGQHYVLLETLQIPVLILGIALMAVGLTAFFLFKWIPGTKRERWPEMSTEAAQEATIFNTMVFAAGAILLPGGMVAVAVLYQLDLAQITAALSVAAAASALGLAFFLWGTARASLLRRVLARAIEIQIVETEPAVESNSTGDTEVVSEEPAQNQVSDPRLAIVLPALDKLLENIPDDALETFKGTQASAIYLELLDELGE